jgi:rubrerythrin
MNEKNQAACKMLSAALEMEEKGREFYEKFSRTCENKECKDIFDMLSKDESLHIKRINKIHEALSTDQPWCEDWDDEVINKDLKEAFIEMAEKTNAKDVKKFNDVEAVETAIKFEEQGLKFYQEKLDKSEDDTEKSFLELMVREERGHYLALTDMKLYLTDPDTWFIEHEKSGLDGA